MEIGYIHAAEQPLSAVAGRYLEHFRGISRAIKRRGSLDKGIFLCYNDNIA